jgi:hypothetical protein
MDLSNITTSYIVVIQMVHVSRKPQQRFLQRNLYFGLEVVPNPRKPAVVGLL